MFPCEFSPPQLTLYLFDVIILIVEVCFLLIVRFRKMDYFANSQTKHGMSCAMVIDIPFRLLLSVAGRYPFSAFPSLVLRAPERHNMPLIERFFIICENGGNKLNRILLFYSKKIIIIIYKCVYYILQLIRGSNTRGRNEA